MRLEIRAIGKMRAPLAEIFAEYHKRIGKELTVTEYEAPKGLTGATLRKKETTFLLADLPPGPVVALDEHGRDQDSEALARLFARWREAGGVVFLIGGADGLADEVRARADLLLSLGRKTWPHLLARVLLAEQIYRARQILAAHPYHRS